jgi:RTX calcium-binding nonapeptide repeat (4 copies)
VLVATPAAARADIGCTHSGPPANVVTFTIGDSADVFTLERVGAEIRLSYERVIGFTRPKGKKKPRVQRVVIPVGCPELTPTVLNTDRIQVLVTADGDIDLEVSLLGGPLAPGATPEPDGASEIELGIQFDESGQVAQFLGGAEANTFRFGTLGGVHGVNLNAESESATPDVDATMTIVQTGPFVDDLTDWPLAYAVGNAGDDTITSVGGPEFAAPFGKGAIAIGGSGNDQVILDAATYNAVEAGPGNDEIHTGLGFNEIVAGGGADTVFGNTGKDQVDLGGGRDLAMLSGGRDEVLSLDGKKDRVRCGGGRDVVVRDRKDRLRRCERKIDRRPKFEQPKVVSSGRG